MGFPKLAKFATTYDIARQAIYFAFGLLYSLSIMALMILGIPIYIFRAIAILLAPYLRPDLGQILNPHSAILAGDTFSSRKPPRGNIVVVCTLDGNISFEGFKRLAMDKWIEAREVDGQLKYPQFTQVLISWLGFMFWKEDKNFDVNNHVHCHNPSSVLGRRATDEDLNDLVETLLNAPHHPNRSPWEYHLIQSYYNPKIQSEEMSVLLLKIHHSLADGYSLVNAFTGGLFDGEYFQLPKAAQHPKRDLWEQFAYTLTFPFAMTVELAMLVKEQFNNCPWKIPDEKKEWHQFYSKSELIPIQHVKQIKNTFRVSFTSVLVSAISAGISKTLLERKVSNALERSKTCIDKMPLACILPLPAIGRKSRLTNHATAAMFNLPVGNYATPLERLCTCDKILKRTVNSVVPILAAWWIACIGSHVRWVSHFVSKNRAISTGLSNLPIFGEDFNGSILGRKILCMDSVVGGLEGVAGAWFTVISFQGYIRVAVTVEQGLLSRIEADTLVGSVVEEINKLLRIYFRSVKKIISSTIEDGGNK